MSEEQQRFMALLGKLPARLNVAQVSWVLNCQPHDIPVLVASRIIKPLGNPPPNGVKYFATCDILELSKDSAWLARMSNAICQRWQRKNARKKTAAIMPNINSVDSEAG